MVALTTQNPTTPSPKMNPIVRISSSVSARSFFHFAISVPSLNPAHRS